MSVPRQSGGNIWATLVQLTQAAIILIVLSGLLLFFVPVIQKTQNLQHDKLTLQNSIAAARINCDFRLNQKYRERRNALCHHAGRCAALL